MLTRIYNSFRLTFSRESGWLFPPSEYCPHDCDACTLPCKLSRYHLGPHTLGKGFFLLCSVARKIPRGGAGSMQKLDAWVCPVCNMIGGGDENTRGCFSGRVWTGALEPKLRRGVREAWPSS